MTLHPNYDSVSAALRRLFRHSVLLVCFSLPAFPGCRLSERAPAHTPVGRSGEWNVRPGINDPYREPDLDVRTWVDRFESESREIFKQRHRIVESMNLTPGMTVADIGAGTGLFTPLLSKAVGPSGRVLAVDIVPAFLELIRERARREGLQNVQTVLCDEDSVRLPPASIHAAFVCDTYHHFEFPQSTLRSIHRALKSDGRLVVVDFDRLPGRSREWVLNHVRAGRKLVIREITSAGFVLETEQPDDSFLEENYILRFRKIE